VIDSIGENNVLLMTLGQLYMNSGKVEVGSEILKRAFLLGEGTPSASA
jgi:uncharacterized protein HemY